MCCSHGRIGGVESGDRNCVSQSWLSDRNCVQSSAAERLAAEDSLASSASYLLELKTRFQAWSATNRTSKRVLEVAKFGLYVAIPITLMYTFANNSQNIQRFMGNRPYIVYPEAAERPPSPEEIREMARELARKNSAR